MGKPIFVTQPHLPSLSEFLPYLEEIWESRWITNNGPFHQRLEQALCDYLGVEFVSLFTNGTLGLVTALQALRITGEVITTPFSFVATSHALLWNGSKPVFVDIDPTTYNLDPSKIEAAITPRTVAIMPVHCYGVPCDIEAIQRIADVYNLKVIYDAAHAFAVGDPGGSILRHGDLSVLSFHATKVFNTFEGGAVVCHDEKMKQRIDYLKNFGFADETTVVAPGINGKMSEFNAALGVLQLKHVDAAIIRRREIDAYYRAALAQIPGLQCLALAEDIKHNYAYFPVRVSHSYPLTRDELYHLLRENGVMARRYFYPLISEFPAYRALPSAERSNLPCAYLASKEVLCLPIYPDLKNEQVEMIADILRYRKGVSKNAAA